MYRIEKPSIFIVSGGRTGTAFFTKLFNTSSNLTSAYHEPENIDYFNLTEIKTKSKHFGLCNLTVRKLCGRWGITNLSNQRMAGKISVTEAAQKLLDQRRTFIEGQDAEIYVESSYHFYGLIDIIPLIFENYKIVYIVRDPRDWVRSHMDKKEWYHFTNPATLFGTRISPRLIGDTRYTAQWKSMDRFEKLCWAWQMINSYALDMIKKTGSENIQYMRFEDIFAAGNKKEKMEQLLSFLSNFKEKQYDFTIDLDSKMSQKVNKPEKYSFPHWHAWNTAQARKLDKSCGELMAALDYGKENLWIEKIS